VFIRGLFSHDYFYYIIASPTTSIQINLYFTALDKEHFLCIKHLTLNFVMDVWIYLVSSRAVHIGNLLGEIVWGKKLDSPPCCNLNG